MAQTQAIITHLKQLLRESRITYADVARQLELSEASVKRLFAQQQLSLQRLDQICALLGMEISDVLRHIGTAKQIDQLSLAHEAELVADTKLMIAAFTSLNHWTFEEILKTYDFEQPELISKLTRLDKIGFIELLPNNRIKPLVSQDFEWQKSGPIQTYFESQVQTDFFNCHFTQTGELRLFVTGMISVDSNKLMHQKIKRLAQDFRHLHDEDLNLPLEQRHGASMVLAIRPWELQHFEQYRRSGTEKHYPA
ncbi:helix-turn-helix domain-containing protein [Bacterioplanoides sp.]|uniref:helix-turn-helix domain-containing protein n=1 Tax=Bacterioplanoides sp. TaxID=2066072 RepID=UPI003AFF8CBD